MVISSGPPGECPLGSGALRYDSVAGRERGPDRSFAVAWLTGESILPSALSRFAWSKLRLWLLVAGSALFVFLVVVIPIARNHGLISTDEASWIAPAVAIVRGTGAPYVNYFDVKPPGLVFFFVPWIAVFGASMKSLVVLDVLLLAANLSLFYYLLRRLASPLLRDVVYGVSLVAAFGLQLFSGEFVQSETVGSVLLLLALAAVLRFRARPQAFLLAGALCALASQVKEVWFFCVIAFAVFALMDTPGRWRRLASLAAGWVAMTGLVVLGLVALGAAGAYLDVLTYKGTSFPLPGLVGGAREAVKVIRTESVAVWWLWPLLPVVLGLAFYLRVRVIGAVSALRETLSFRDSTALLAFLTWLCLVPGYVWQNKPVQGHTFVMLFYPFVFFTTGALVYAQHAFSDPKSWRLLKPRGVVAVVLVLSLIPSSAVAAGLGDRYQEIRGTPLDTLLTMESSASLQKYAVIESHLSGTGCLQVAYGWDAGAADIYTGANPCSRYFLSDLITTRVVADEFRRDMVARPPDVIVYETDMTDMDVTWFEKTVFPYSRVLAECYNPTDTPTVFVARYAPAEQSRCIGDQLKLGVWGP